jgi:AhpD family alkylhydroperoxidase
MLQAIEQMIFRNLTPLSIRHLPPPDIGRAEGLSAEVYRQLEQEFQTVPPITMHHLDPGLMSGVWSACRETLVAGPERALKERVAVAVSGSNRCPYCVQAHTSFLEGAGGDGSAFDAVGRWAAATGDQARSEAIEAPFSVESAPAAMGTAVMFHYINRMVNLFLDDTMMPVIGKVPLLRGPAMRIFSAVVSGRIAALDVAPGKFLTETPEVALPPEFRWAAGNPYVAGGLQRFAAAAEAAGSNIDDGTRKLLLDAVAVWNGFPPGPGKGWLDGAVAVLPERSRPQARIAFLAAMASWAMDEREVTAFRREGGDGRALLDTAAWGAYLAAKRIAGWLNPPR